MVVVKCAKRKRRGIQMDVKMYKIGQKLEFLCQAENPKQQRRLFGITQASKIRAVAEFCFHSICRWCCVLHFLPAAEYVGGEVVLNRRNWKRMTIHCILIAAQVTNALHKARIIGPLLFGGCYWRDLLATVDCRPRLKIWTTTAFTQRPNFCFCCNCRSSYAILTHDSLKSVAA